MMKTEHEKIGLFSALLLLSVGAGCATTQPAREPAEEPVAEAAPSAPREWPTTPDAEFRQQKPPALEGEVAFEAPVPEVTELKNGLRVLTVENRQVPLVALQLVVQAGVDADPRKLPGLANLVASMLDEGTRSRTAMQVAEELEDMAASMSISADGSSMSIHLNVLEDTLPRAVEILADLALNPAFRPEDLERVRGILLTRLEQKKGVPQLIARDELSRLLYGAAHPWGQPDGGTVESVKAMKREDLVRFHDAWFRPNNAFISVAGDTSSAEVTALLEAQLGRWKAGKLPAKRLPPLPKDLERLLVLVDRASASQSQVWMGGHLFPATHPDAIPLRVANFVLGGMFSSRLNRNLREDKGYSYGASSRPVLMREVGVMLASAGIIAEHTAAAVSEFQKELERFAQGELTEEEFQRAKIAYVGSLPSALETNNGLSSAMSSLLINGLPLDYYRTLSGKVEALTKADLERVAREHIQPARWPVVVVGPMAENGEKLRALELGPVQERAPYAPSARPAAAR